ncbi:MAG: winged helix-turn-helix domain-containing protein [Terriglobia bacterium]|jgi:Tol biopolymer transport system component/DNA-binding winged helix-turn-helix (wHTH) protein
MKPNSSSPAQARIGSFALDIQAGELHKSGFKVRLQEQPRQVLAMLIDRPGEVVTREELRRRLWPADTFVDFDHGLNKAINKLREALGDDPDKPRYIETLPRRGYRLIAPVEPVQALPSSPNGELSIKPATVGAPPPLQKAGTDQTRWRVAVVAMLGIILAAIFALWFATHRAQPKPELKQRRLTANPLEHPVSGAAISPDGKYLAYSDPAGIHVKLIETGETHTVTPQVGFRSGGEQAGRLAPSKPAWVLAGWFPDGVRLLANLGEDKGYSIWTLSILGGSPRKLREAACANSVSPDGSLIAFTTGGTPSMPFHELWVMGPQGEQARTIAIADQNRQFVEAVWAPDGRRIATLAWGDRRAIETHDLTGGRRILVASNPDLGKNFEGLVWLSDGRLIYPQAEPPPNQSYDNLWEIKADPRTGEPVGKPSRVTNWVDTHFWGLSASADGKRLAFIKGNPQADVYVGELEANGRRLKAPKRLTLDEHYDIPFGWTPDGKAVLFVSDRNGSLNIFKQALDQDSAEALTAGSEPHLEMDDCLSGGAPRLSPDGLWILYSEATRKDDSESSAAPHRLMRFPVAGGPSEFVLEAGVLPQIRCALPPATLCVLGEWNRAQKQLVLTALDPLKGRGRELARIKAQRPSGIVGWALSQDASRIAYSQYDEQEGRIRILSLNDKTSADVVVRNWHSFLALAWAPDGKGLFVSCVRPNAFAILYTDLQGRAYPLWEREGSLKSWALPSPDGRHLAILGPTWDSNAWLLENF